MKLHLTQEAKGALRRLISDSRLDSPYITIVGGTDVTGANWGWNVGLYAKERISAETVAPNWIQEIDDFPFVIDVLWHEKLDGKTLDYQHGHFHVR